MKKSLNILIVDDNIQFINRIISLIDDILINKEISIASDFDSAILQLEQGTRDIVLLDINMPGKSGIEVLRHIRNNYDSTEVAMLTNHTDVVYREQCASLGARFFLDKTNDFLLVPEILTTLYSHLNEPTEE